MKAIMWVLVAVATLVAFYAVVRTADGPNATTDHLFLSATLTGSAAILAGVVNLYATIGNEAKTYIGEKVTWWKSKTGTAQKYGASTIRRFQAVKRTNLLPFVVLAVSIAFIGIGLRDLAHSLHRASDMPAVALCGIGLAGVAFLAWLKR